MATSTKPNVSSGASWVSPAAGGMCGGSLGVLRRPGWSWLPAQVPISVTVGMGSDTSCSGQLLSAGTESGEQHCKVTLPVGLSLGGFGEPLLSGHGERGSGVQKLVVAFSVSQGRASVCYS